MLELIADGGDCAGAWLLGHDELRPLRAGMTLIATGGAGALYARTTNPPGALGDGIAIAAPRRRGRARTWSSCSSTPPRWRSATAPS